MRKASSRDALLMPNLSLLFLPLPGLFRSSIFRTAASRALSISCASRNPVGKLIRSDNPEEFDWWGFSPPLPTGVNPSHIRERLPLIIFSCWILSLSLSYIHNTRNAQTRPLGVSPGFSHRNTRAPRARALRNRGVGVHARVFVDDEEGNRKGAGESGHPPLALIRATSGEGQD